MNYTREPIIETVITPKEGSKLVLRNSKKHSEQEDFFVDSVEIVSFGSSLFFRSIERPKPFLLPVTDYEVLELRETKMVLKSASLETPSIKIAGGKETRQQAPQRSENMTSPDQPQQHASERKGKRRSRRRRPSHSQHQASSQENGSRQASPAPTEEGVKVVMPVVSSPTLLTPPPTTLIKEKLSKYKAAQDERQEQMSVPPQEHRPHVVQEETNPT